MMNIGDAIQSGATSPGRSLKGDTDEAIRFLKAFPGRHNLWAKDPDGGFNEGRTFEPNSWDAIKKWVDARQGRMNIYFSVNEPKAGIQKKLEKGDVARIRAVHLDLDVPKDERQDPDRLVELKAALRTTIDEIEADDETLNVLQPSKTYS